MEVLSERRAILLDYFGGQIDSYQIDSYSITDLKRECRGLVRLQVSRAAAAPELPHLS